ncbi:MAG: holin [Clostridium sp.]|uniref:phage holin n=1 Tax=Clostridium sp. TaxID=1506 RepID=UPI0030448F61
MDLTRFKNYGLWISIFAFIPLVLKAFNVDVLPSNYTEIISSFLGILVVAGIISDPTTTSKGYLDDKVEKSEDAIDKIEE